MTVLGQFFVVTFGGNGWKLDKEQLSKRMAFFSILLNREYVAYFLAFMRKQKVKVPFEDKTLSYKYSTLQKKASPLTAVCNRIRQVWQSTLTPVDLSLDRLV